MPQRVERDGISVRAIRGTRAVIFAMDASEQARRGLLGFAIGKRRTDGSIGWLRGFKFFEETVSDPQPGERRSTFDHPIQSFSWGDYNVDPGEQSDYVVRPVRGSPGALDHGTPVNISVRTASEEGGEQTVLFNRGAIPSQAFADRFGNTGPSADEQNDPANAKVRWLSRGLLEGALNFIAQATGPQFELRVAAYEFYYPPILDALLQAAGRGATVRISFDGGDQKRDGTITPTDLSQKNYGAISEMGLDNAAGVSLHPRTLYSAITHNKFMVLLENGQPRQVLTGSTNFTSSGFLGQSNVIHILRKPDIAKAYNAYWKRLSLDPATRLFKTQNMDHSPDPGPGWPNQDITPIFSPRRAGMMEWYASRFGDASSSVMFTAAFGVAPQIAAKFAEDRDYLRFVLMERKDRNAEEQAMVESDRDTRIALGARLNSQSIRYGLAGSGLDNWFREEEHFRKKGHIFYIHTKFMLLDALGDNPLIFSGSANFSYSSVKSNDENMLLLAGDAAREVSEIYVSEFDRLFRHLYFRTVALNIARRRRRGGAGERSIAYLDPTDAWVASHFAAGSYRDKRRRLFR